MQPSEEELEQQRLEQLVRERQQRVNDSLAEIARIEREARLQEQQQQPVEIITEQGDTTASYSLLKQKYGAFGTSGQGEKELITVENDVMKITFSNKGGRIASVELTQYKTDTAFTHRAFT